MKLRTMAKTFSYVSVALVSIVTAMLIPATAYAAPNGYAASDVLGQLTAGVPDLTTSNSGVTADHINYPSGAALDTVHHRLFVTDSSNNRVLVYSLDSHNNITSHTASYVLGQPTFTSNLNTTTQAGVNSPYAGLAYDAVSDRLFVADSNNNRVLVYSLSGGITNGMNASNVLGQPNFTTSTGNLSQSGLNLPNGLAYDPVHQALYVADGNNIRVLMYDVAPSNITNGMNASHVIGQPDFITTGSFTTQAGLQHPIAITYNSVTQTLFVGDNNANRILTFDMTGSVTNGMNASHVLCQPTFTSQNPPSGSPTASTT